MGKGCAGCVFHYHRMQRMELDTNILPSPHRSKAKRVSTSGQIPTIQNDSNNTIHPERQLYRVYLSTGGSHVTIIHAALDLTVQTPLAPSSPRHETRDPFPWPQPPLLVTFGDHHRRPCSLDLTVQPHRSDSW